VLGVPPLTATAALEAWRRAIAGARGAARWQVLQQFADSPEFSGLLQREHPRLAAAAAMNRRDFFRYALASLALAGLAGCGRAPPERVVPMRRQDERGDSDGPRFYATTLPFDGYGSGVLVQSNEGRPTKVEGNPAHPASLGATDIFAQAAVLDLWDPDRSQALLKQGRIAGWDDFLAEMTDRLAPLDRSQGAGLHILTGAVSSPSLQAQLDALRQRYPQARHHVWQPWPRDNVYAGTALAFGEALEPVYRFDRAEVIVALDADFLGSLPGRVRHARDFIDGRRISGSGPPHMNRLYAAECTPSLTGSMADHRLALDSRALGRLAAGLAARLGIAAAGESLPEPQRRWIEAAAADLQQHRGAALVLAGEAQPPAVHALAHAMNTVLDGAGRSVDYVEPVINRGAASTASIADLTTAMRQGQVSLLLMLDCNPLWDAPAGLGFADALGRVACSVHLGLYADETAAASRWHIPQAHPLESWSDLRAYDGSISLQQPLVEPLYQGRTAHEVLAVLQQRIGASSHQLLQDYWRSQVPQDFDTFWGEALRRGLVPDSQPRPRKPGLRRQAVIEAAAALPPPGDGLELVFRPDPTVWDGRYANSGWLQELPKPASQLTWSNPLLIGDALARRLGLSDGDEVRLQLDGEEVLAPVWISRAQAPQCITAFLGYGRERAGRIGSGLGFDAYRLRRSQGLWFASGPQLQATGRRHSLAATQRHFDMEGREPVRQATLAEFAADPAVIRRSPREDGPFPSLYAERPAGEYAWAMHIDLNACTGCKVCTIACQAENNIPVVGAEQVRLGRAMHWIRVDAYDDEQTGMPQRLHQPVPCMHCEHAPCELVCPVGATVHDSEGLNLQVYNRCVGTRFCSNNCPYKVRRFNFLQYADIHTESLKGLRNPQVTVRNRGVMEKCTYCVQRIRAAELSAEKQNRRIGDGEVQTACEAACPTRAIRFGDLRDPASAVAQAKSSPLHYVLLAELNTRPRTTYSARLRNPHPALDDGEDQA
jgi:molybdopterin-containing oxidoreductase family iron-sulfur binding subunit